MFRMTTLALAAAATLAVTTIAPTAASAADGWRHRDRDNHRSGVTLRFAAPHYAYASRCHISRRWVRTHGHWVRRTVRVCR